MIYPSTAEDGIPWYSWVLCTQVRRRIVYLDTAEKCLSKLKTVYPDTTYVSMGYQEGGEERRREDERALERQTT
jgi:hypothetical protein